MKRIISSIAILSIIVCCLCACGGSKTPETIPESDLNTTTAAADPTNAAAAEDNSALVGNWQEDVFNSGFVFNSDGTGTDTFWDLTFTYSTEGDEILIVYDSDTYGASSYKYELNGDTLVMTRLDDEENSSFTYTRTEP